MSLLLFDSGQKKKKSAIITKVYLCEQDEHNELKEHDEENKHNEQ